jgi:hypothetical protein
MHRSKGKTKKRFYHNGPSAFESHLRPDNVDVTAPNAGATPTIEGNIMLAVPFRFAEVGYEPFAYVQLTQEFVDRLYRLARIAHDEVVEHLEVEHSIEWNVEMYKRRPQQLRIARNHFYWTGSSPCSWVEANTAPVLFSELEEQLALANSTGAQTIFIGIEDPADRAEVLTVIATKIRSRLLGRYVSPSLPHSADA